MIPAGYLYKRIVPAPAWMRTPDVEVHSVSGCISPCFADYVPRWRHNGWWLFDAPRVLDALVAELEVDAEGLTLLYYEVFEEQWDETSRRWSTFGPEPSLRTAVEVAPHADRLGWDVVTFCAGTSPECSPLSCCGLAAEIPVNRYCLLDSLERAKEALERGRFDGSEPGPFRIFSVHRPRGVASGGERGFRVWRQDEHGNVFEVSRGHTEQEARRLAEALQATQHKQLYGSERERRRE